MVKFNDPLKVIVTGKGKNTKKQETILKDAIQQAKEKEDKNASNR
jgi:hypothetical protein